MWLNKVFVELLVWQSSPILCIFKWAKDLSENFSKEEIQVANKYIYIFEREHIIYLGYLQTFPLCVWHDAFCLKLVLYF